MTTQVVFGSHGCVKKKGSANTFLTTVDARLLLRTASHDRHRALSVTQIKQHQNEKKKRIKSKEAARASYRSDTSIER